jgi:hypothetical protein
MKTVGLMRKTRHRGKAAPALDSGPGTRPRAGIPLKTFFCGVEIASEALLQHRR